LAEHLCATLEGAIPILIKSATFDEFIKHAQAQLIVEKETSRLLELIKAKEFSYSVQQAIDVPREQDKDWIAAWGIASKNKILMNVPAKQMFDSIHDNFKRLFTS
jgi:hypothetical protein